MVAKVARHRDVVAKVMRVLGRENEWKKIRAPPLPEHLEL